MFDRRSISGALNLAVRFGIVGAACSVLNVFIVYFGTSVLHLHYAVALLTTCLITIPLSYFAHRGFTFGIRGALEKRWREAGRFVIAQVGQFVLGFGLLMAAVEWAFMTPVVGMVAVTALMFLFGLAANGAWVFRAFGSPAR